MAQVTLTFDNGPDSQATPLVLDCLARQGVKSTFFVLGQKVSTPAGLDLARRASREGHWIGNHTWSHGDRLGDLTREAALEEFSERSKRSTGSSNLCLCFVLKEARGGLAKACCIRPWSIG